jgi:hypothetical protein
MNAEWDLLKKRNFNGRMYGYDEPIRKEYNKKQLQYSVI